jgi:hypothetical protein
MERWKSEWQKLSDRILEAQNMASMILTASGMHSNGFNFEVLHKYALKPMLAEIVRALNAFHVTYSNILPSVATSRLQVALGQINDIGRDLERWTSSVSVSFVLMALRAEVSASLFDPEAVGRKHTERAFEHLQRSIVADESYRERWNTAYNAGETACERLGSVHLLLHGIWAFKAHAEGERTDLVLQDKLAVPRAEMVADTLVLTEWKLAKKIDEVRTKAGDGKRQAMIYSGSSLAALELATVRYVVLVTKERVQEQMPDDEHEGQIVYRYINIAVSPRTPSAAARKRQ